MPAIPSEFGVTLGFWVDKKVTIREKGWTSQYMYSTDEFPSIKELNEVQLTSTNNDY